MRQICEQTGLAETAYIYHPDRDFEDTHATRSFDDLLTCDTIFILSPNSTHYGYLEKCKDFKGYIFCEKPPVSTSAELERLKMSGLDPARVYFNFHYRQSPLTAALSKGLRDGTLGRILHVTATNSQGLAFKDVFIGSWRANGESHPNGIAETKAVHQIDLLSLMFSKPVSVTYDPSNASGRGSAPDTCRFSLKYDNGTTAEIFTTWAGPCIEEFRVIGTEAILELKDGILALYGPRDTFDSRSLFVAPPAIWKKTFDQTDHNRVALEASASYFLETCRKKKGFPPRLFEQSLATCEFLFDLKAS